MSYEAVLEQVKTAPEACLDEISQIIGYVVFRYKQKNEQLEEFTAMCDEAQRWAKSVGMKESDISAAIKEARAEKRRA